MVIFTEEILNGNFIFCAVSGGRYKLKDTGIEKELMKWMKKTNGRHIKRIAKSITFKAKKFTRRTSR